ncbi:MAG: ribonuclease P protein component [Paracoccaceae bacterium]
MMPPDTPAAGHSVGLPGNVPAALACAKPVILTKRADFVRAASARRQSTPGFLLQARARAAGEGAPIDAIRIGYTCSKKVGNAVTRNRAKRRLREIARLALVAAARPGWDYVLVGRPGATVDRDFAALLDDLSRALASVHGSQGRHPK